MSLLDPMITDKFPTRTKTQTHFFEFLVAWTARIVRARYQQSALGILWALIQPSATAIIFSVVFTFFVDVNTGDVPYILFSYVALVPWTLFSNGLTDMVNSIVENMNLVTKIYFPREIIPLAALLARVLDFGIALALFVPMVLYFQRPLLSPALIVLPLILLIQLALVAGLGLAGAAMNVFFRDIKYLLVLGLQILLYASPIIYPVSSVPEKLMPYYFLNPMAGIVESYRAVLLYGTFPGPALGLSAFLSFCALAIGYWFFKRVEFQFADLI